MSVNQNVSKSDLKKIRNLEDFDLIMLISEIHDHGWSVARCTLCQMPPADMAEFRKRQAACLKLRQPVGH